MRGNIYCSKKKLCKLLDESDYFNSLKYFINISYNFGSINFCSQKMQQKVFLFLVNNILSIAFLIPFQVLNLNDLF